MMHLSNTGHKRNKENINELLNTLKVLELSPDDLEIQIDYAQCLVQLGIAKKAEHLFYDNIIYNRHLEDSFMN